MRLTLVVVAACALFPASLVSQAKRPSAPYGAVVVKADDSGSMWRWLFGQNWRDQWARPVVAPTLDLNSTGGLTPFKRGGNETATLHFRAGDGHRYVFRSVAKGGGAVLRNKDLRGTAVAAIVQDQSTTQYPGAAAIMDVMQSALGVLHPVPRIVRLPDDARLGEYRKEFAGQVGYFEIKPSNDSADVEPFARADKIRETDDMLDDLDASLRNRLDVRDYLALRLLDGLVGDLDRGADNVDWARYDHDGTHTYRPIARDRDWALMRADGQLMKQVRHSYRKMGVLDADNEEIDRITFMTHEFDRSQLVALPRSAWDSIVGRVQSMLTPAVVDSALRADPWSDAATKARIAGFLTSRISALPAFATDFFLLVNQQVDIFAADERELAEIDRGADGSVRVRLSRVDSGGRADPPVFDRTFTPDVTREIRVYLQEGDDRAIVRGTAPRSITVRVAGGGGDDVLIDSSVVAHGKATFFYDGSGKNVIVRGRNTAVDTRPFKTAQPGTLDAKEDSASSKHQVHRTVEEERLGRFEDERYKAKDALAQQLEKNRTRTWGSTSGITPALKLRADDGAIVGLGYSRTTWGFRADPYASRLSATVLYGVNTSRLGAELRGKWRGENSNRFVDVRLSAFGFGVNRFFGYGNDSPLLSGAQATVNRDAVDLQSMIRWDLAKNTTVGIGAIVRYSAPRLLAGSPAATLHPIGASEFGAAGGTIEFTRTSVDLPGAAHRGYRFSLSAAEYPALWDAKSPFGTARAEVDGYVPLWKATLALRAVGERAWGAFPLHEAAFMGGVESLRGYSFERFAGDAAAFGSSELRVPFARVAPLVRGDLGIILLADAGRVWLDSNSPGDWHTSYGGGLSFASMGRAVSVVWAHGDVSRLYVYLGYPF